MGGEEGRFGPGDLEGVRDRHARPRFVRILLRAEVFGVFRPRLGVPPQLSGERGFSLVSDLSWRRLVSEQI